MTINISGSRVMEGVEVEVTPKRLLLLQLALVGLGGYTGCRKGGGVWEDTVFFFSSGQSRYYSDTIKIK